MPRVTMDDLAFAADFLESYEAAPGEDENGTSAARVAVWLRSELSKRREAAAVRRVCDRRGWHPATFRNVLRQVRKKNAGGA